MGDSFVRLDKLLVDKGLTSSRERAQSLILAAKVVVNGVVVTKAGHRVSAESLIELRGEELPFVSRGGLKLRHALEAFSVNVEDLVGMDVGASTGGFTDCLLQHGARRIYAVDVGYGQLAWELRQNQRVVVLERQNIRYLPREMVPEPIQIATIDTSFISLKLVIPAVLPFMASPSHLIALIKPQFEAGRKYVKKGGVVRDSQVHQRVCEEIEEFCKKLRLQVKGLTPSPILGPKGNLEFLICCSYGDAPSGT